jgi:hypothetical protein
LKYHLSDIVQVALFDAQEAQNEFAWLFDTLIHRFIVFNTVVYEDVYKADYEFAGQFAYLKHHLRDFVQIAFLNVQNVVCVGMAFRNHETSLHRLHLSAILRRSEGILLFSGPFAYLKHHLSDFIQVALFDAQDTKNDFVLPFVTLKHRFIDFT